MSILPTLPRLYLLAVQSSGLNLVAADAAMRVTDRNILDDRGFSGFLDDRICHPVSVDSKNAAMENQRCAQMAAEKHGRRALPLILGALVDQSAGRGITRSLLLRRAVAMRVFLLPPQAAHAP
jgi:hypothetical protein